MLKQYIDKDRKTLPWRFPNNIPLIKLEEKEIIKPKPISGYAVDGIKREKDNWDEYTIDDLCFRIAKKNYTKIFGEIKCLPTSA